MYLGIRLHSIDSLFQTSRNVLKDHNISTHGLCIFFTFVLDPEKVHFFPRGINSFVVLQYGPGVVSPSLRILRLRPLNVVIL